MAVSAPAVGTRDHGSLEATSLLDDDHTQYLLLAGRSGGQTAYGGDAAGEILELQGADSTPDVGRVHINSPLEFFYNTIDNTTPAEQYLMRWRPTGTIGVAYIGGVLRLDYDQDVGTGTFVPGTFVDAGRYTQTASPVFAAYTFINVINTLRTNSAFNPPNALVCNVGTVAENTVSGLRTQATMTGLSFSPQTRATTSGATMARTNQAAVTVNPTFSTVTGSTAALGTVTGIQLNAPAVALAQPQLGTETLTAYYGLRMTNITFTSSGNKAAVFNEMTDAANRFCILNSGGARSDFGGGNLLDCGIVQILADNTALSLGAAGGDVQINWNGSALEYDPITGEDLRWSFAVGSHTLESANFGTDSELRMGFDRFHFGQTGAVGNQVGVFVAPARTTSINGEWSDFLLTQAGNLTIDDTMSAVYAWTINAVSLTSGTGSITGEVATLNVGGMTTSGLGGNDTSSIRSTGRHNRRGCVRLDPINPANLTGTVNAWAGLLTGSQNNGMRGWARFTCDAVTTLNGIDSTAALDGDKYELTNVGSNTLTINHQNGSAAAADRIITTTGAAITIAADEGLVLIYDLTTARWRAYKRT